MRTIGSPYDEWTVIGDKIAWLKETKSVKPMKIKDKTDPFINRKYPSTVYWTRYEKEGETIIKAWMDSFCIDLFLADDDMSLGNKKLDDYNADVSPPLAISTKSPSIQDNLSFAKSLLLRNPKEYKYVVFDDSELAKYILK